MIEAFQAAALALPVSDRVIDEREFAQSTEIRDGKYALKNTLQPDVVTLVGQQVHLQKALVRSLLNLDQIRNRNRGLDLRKINTFSDGAFCGILHLSKLLKAGDGLGQRLLSYETKLKARLAGGDIAMPRGARRAR
jgi:hypothetical protein